jgi:hypothetical protein
MNEIIELMEHFGGNFVKALAKCYRVAESRDRSILELAFAFYFQEYYEMSKRRMHEK